MFEFSNISGYSYQIIALYDSEHWAVKAIWLCIPLFFAVSIVIIRLTLRVRKTRKKNTEIREILEPTIKKNIIGLLLSDDFHGQENFKRTHYLKSVSRNKKESKIAIQIFLNLKTTLEGKLAKKLDEVYSNVGFKSLAIDRLNHKNPQVRIGTVKELALMGCHDVILDLYSKQRKAHSEEENLNLLLAMAKKEPLKVLDFIVQDQIELDEWRQIELMSLLQNSNNIKRDEISRMINALRSTQPGLWSKLTISYLTFGQENDYLQQMNHATEEARYHILKVLEKTPARGIRLPFNAVKESRLSGLERLEISHLRRKFNHSSEDEENQRYSSLLKELNFERIVIES